MPSTARVVTPGLQTFLASLKECPVDKSIAYFIALLKRRQIRNSWSCAMATAQLMRQVVEQYEVTDFASLIKRVQEVGQQLTLAQPKELAVGNIVRRVLGVIRDEAEEDRDVEGDHTGTNGGPRTPGTSAHDESLPLEEAVTSSNGSAYILDFGQHFGAQLSAVPPSYIRWLITAGVHATRPDLMAALRKQGFLTDPVLKDSPPSSSSNGQQQSAAWTAPSIHATNDARFFDAHRQTPRWTSDTDLSRMDGEGNSFSQPHPAQTASLSSTDRPLLNSMFSLLSHPMSNAASPIATLGNESPRGASTLPNEGLIGQATATDLGAEVGEAIEEIIEELETADDQIAGYASDHIHSNEIILTYGPSVTVQKFLLKAASKRKFTVMHAESFPNNHESVHATVSGSLKGGAGDTGPDRFHRSLTAAGITVILIPDSAIFAVMSRVNKIIIGTHAVLANGGLVAAAGARMLAKAASMHKTPVVVLSGVYKLSPIYPFNTDAFIEYGDAGKVIPYEDGGLIDKVEVENPLHDYVPPELIDLYITNLGAHAPSYLYIIVADHYRAEDTHLTQKEVY